MTIDERLEFLVQSTESLHTTVSEMIEENRRRDEENRRRDDRERLHRVAILKAIQAYLAAADTGS